MSKLDQSCPNCFRINVTDKARLAGIERDWVEVLRVVNDQS